MALTLLLALLSGQQQVLITNPTANPAKVTCVSGCSGSGGGASVVTLDGGESTAFGRATSAAPSYTNNTDDPLSLDLGGGLRINISGQSLAAVTVQGTVSVSSVGGTVSDNVSQWGGVATSLGQKVSASSVPVVLSSDFTPTIQGTVSVSNFPATQAENLTQIAGNSVNTGVGTGGTGTQRVALDTASGVNQLGTWTVQPGNTQNTTAWYAEALDSVGTPTVLNGTGATGPVSLGGLNTASVTFTSGGTLNATVVPECSYDGTTSWVTGWLVILPLTVWVQSATATFSSGSYEIICSGGASHARLRVSVYTSGSSTATMRATAAARSWESPTLSGIGTATQPQAGVQIGGWDGANFRMVGAINATSALKTDLSSVAGTATSTATAGVLLVGIEGRAGTSFETTAGVLDNNLKNVGNSAVSTAASGVQKVGVVGNAGAVFDAANNGAAPANVVVQGYEAATQGTTQPTAATAGNVRRVVMSTDGAQYVRNGGPVAWSAFVEAVTVTTQVRAAPAAGLRAYVTSIDCSNEAATVQSVDVVFGTGTNCGTGTTALTHKHQMGTLATTTSPFLVHVVYLNPLVPTAANAICVRPSAATAFGCTVTGYDAP